ncbi:hypothetical protein [Vagococcus fluvialis]|uniref:Uncharacterized protein n=1 Tax=Vagococcus fluvialis TaxID=2738 RepID=A0A7X6D906_9ENTE|nr:hypothetical protein [Vagococcus fluvialis]NKC68024.1 hypothetical protein [Vagococcus fluvialis]
MTKLIYGRNKQVQFKDKKEKEEAFNYLLSSDNIAFYHEKNKEKGAWGNEDRIHIKSEEGVPDSLKRMKTAGGPGLYGRINCKELVDELRSLKK